MSRAWSGCIATWPTDASVGDDATFTHHFDCNRMIKAMQPPRSPISRPLGRLTSPIELVRQFTPNWFTATMGTGILALALNQVGLPSLHPVAVGLWLLDIVLFILFSGLYLARWVFFFDGAKRIFGHSVMSMFFGAIPMGLATIVNGFIAFGPTLLGSAAFRIAHGLWWLDVLLALASGLLIPFLMFTQQEHSVEKMTAVWLLPIVAAEVAAASGAQLIPHLADHEAAFRLLILNYALWAFSVPLALSVLVVLVLRLILHKLPHKDMAASSWLALGPIGTGALGLLLLGQDAPATCAAVGMPFLGNAAQAIGIIGGAVLWGYGAWWLLLAGIVTARYLREGIPFNIGWWGFIFPLGVYAVATLALGRETGIAVFTEIGIVLVGLLAVLWCVVMLRTVLGAWRGDLFFAPCLLSNVAPLRDPRLAEADIA